MSQSNFLGDIIQGNPGSVFALCLPSREDKSCRLEDQINLRPAGRLGSEAGGEVCHVKKSHQLEGQGLKGEAGFIPIVGLQLDENIGERFFVTGRLKTGHSRALQNRPLQGGLFISVFLIQARGFSISSYL
ncbi:MAG: hypothetical protein ABSF38_14590, partial [Verrucomicrobiota bacterium]